MLRSLVGIVRGWYSCCENTRVSGFSWYAARTFVYIFERRIQENTRASQDHQATSIAIMESTGGLRTKYITANERSLLLSLIEERKSILFDKSHDHRIINKKKAAWSEVTTLFNSAGFGPQRSQQQLKKIWENSKGK